MDPATVALVCLWWELLDIGLLAMALVDRIPAGRRTSRFWPAGFEVVAVLADDVTPVSRLASVALLSRFSGGDLSTLTGVLVLAGLGITRLPLLAAGDGLDVKGLTLPDGWERERILGSDVFRLLAAAE